MDVSDPPSPQKRSRSGDGVSTKTEKELQTTPHTQSHSIISNPTELIISPQLKRGLIVRDFHLEAVVNNQPESTRRKQQLETPPMVTVPSQDSQSLVEIQPTTTPTNTPQTTPKQSKHKKKKKKQPAFTESDFDYSGQRNLSLISLNSKTTEFTGLFSELGLSLHCLTKDHCCDDKDERTALKMLCPSDPKPMRPSLNDKKLFGKDAIKRCVVFNSLISRLSSLISCLRVGGTLAVTRALGDGYLKLPLLRSFY